MKKVFSTAYELWAPSILLIGIACAQIFSSFYHNLTPWKGGGFGMFSSIDSPNARFIHAQGVDEQRQPHILSSFVGNFEQINISPLSKYTEIRLRTLPDEQLLHDLTEQALLSSWIAFNTKEKNALDKISSQNNSFHASSQEAIKNISFLRPQLNKDSYDDHKEVIHLTEVNCQIWRLRFNTNNAMIWFEPISPKIQLKKPHVPPQPFD